MARNAEFFPASQRDQLRGDLACYARAVISQEWPAMRDGQSSRIVDAWIATYRDLFARLDFALAPRAARVPGASQRGWRSDRPAP